jgi:uncharacterized protein (TIGR03437 family)
VDQYGELTRVAGNSRGGYSGDGGPATSAQLSFPFGFAFDGPGNLYIADAGNNRVRRVSTNGIITTVAGTGVYGLFGDGGPATSATLGYPFAVAVDAKGNLFIADWSNNDVRMVSPNGIITTFAGNGTAGFSGDGGPAASAQLDSPESVAIDGSGNVFIADVDNYRIREVSPNGVVTTVAGNGTDGFSGDGGPAVSAQLGFVQGLAFDGAGNLFFGDGGNNRVRKISADGTVTTVAGIGSMGFSGDTGPAISAQLSGPSGVAVDAAGNLLIADGYADPFFESLAGFHLRRVSTSGIINTIAGTGEDEYSGDGGPATSAHLPYVNTFPAADQAGNLYFGTGNRVLKVSISGIISTVAGTGTAGFSGDGGPTSRAQLSNPNGIAVDGAGNLYIADQGNDVVRKVAANGTITTIAGNGTYGFSGDGGLATSAQLESPVAVAVDGSGNVYIADQSYRIRKVSANGIIETVAGNGTEGYSGDGGLATNAELSNLNAGVAADSLGDLFIADTYNQRIREVSTNGIITTVAGNGTVGTPVDGTSAAGASIFNPVAVTVDGSENLYFTNGFSSILRVSASGIITTLTGVAGPAVGYSGDGGFATSGQFDYLSGIAVDEAGDIFVADSINSAFRKLTSTKQTVLIGAVVDAASESANPISPGKIIVIYGGGLGPSQGVTAAPSNGVFGTQLAGTTVSVNGIAAPIFYASATQVNAIVPYEISGTTANIMVAYAGGISSAFSVPVAASSPSFFSDNATGAGQAAAINDVDGTLNTAANPVKVGAYISFYETGEGQTTPAGVDGKIATVPLPTPNLPVTATVGGLPAVVQYKGAVPGAVAGLMQVNVQIPAGVTPGGYVPVVLSVGNASTVYDAIWIAVLNQASFTEPDGRQRRPFADGSR